MRKWFEGVNEKFWIHNKEKEAEDLERLLELFKDRVFKSEDGDTHANLLWLLFHISVTPTKADFSADGLPNFFEAREQREKQEREEEKRLTEEIQSELAQNLVLMEIEAAY